MSATCKSCGAPIWWAVTKKGKKMPLDPDSDPKGNVVVERGVARVLRLGERPSIDSGERYTSHWATCPSADQHRAAPEVVSSVLAVQLGGSWVVLAVVGDRAFLHRRRFASGEQAVGLRYRALQQRSRLTAAYLAGSEHWRPATDAERIAVEAAAKDAVEAVYGGAS